MTRRYAESAPSTLHPPPPLAVTDRLRPLCAGATNQGAGGVADQLPKATGAGQRSVLLPGYLQRLDTVQEPPSLRALPLCDLRAGQGRRLRRHPRRSILVCRCCAAGGRKELRRGKHAASVQTIGPQDGAQPAGFLHQSPTAASEYLCCSAHWCFFLSSLLSYLTNRMEISTASRLTGKLS